MSWHVRIRSMASGRPAWLAAIVTTLVGLAAGGPAAAAPITAVGGFDHYAGAFGQTTHGVLGAVVVGAGGGDLMLAGVRYDDSHNGQGFSLTGGAGIPMAPAVMLRAQATRIVGDGAFRAWRARVGPQLALPGGGSLLLAYVHYRDDAGARSNGATAEASTPLAARLTGRATTSFATAPLGPPALQGSLGLGLALMRNVELSGELGLARNATGATGGGSPGGGPLADLPLIGAPGASPEERVREVDTTLLLGVRVSLP